MNARTPIGVLATSQAAIERAAQAFSFQPTDADCATVLDALVEANELDDERIDLMLRLAASKRIGEKQSIPPNRERVREALDAMKALIDACDVSLDRSTLLQGAKSEAFTKWHRAGGSNV